MREFADKPGVAVVTGGTGGIGAAVCRGLARAGSATAFTYRSNKTAADELVGELTALPDTTATVRADQLDLTDADATAEYIQRIVTRFGSIHTLVHAAGPLIPQRHLSRVPPAEFGERMQAEATTFFNLVQPALPALRSGGASVVAVTTAATSRYPSQDALSTAPKAAVEATVRALAVEEGRFGVRVNCVGPGMMTDGMSAQLQDSGQIDDRVREAALRNIPLRAFGCAADVADAVCFLVSDRARYISAQKLDVDGGYGA